MTPFIRIKPGRLTSEAIEYFQDKHGLSRRLALARLQSERANLELYGNDVYMARVFRDRDPIHLTIWRIDLGVIKRDWRVFQEIKNQILGPETEAIELFPAESRKMDISNVYHLWALRAGAKFPFGCMERDTPEYDRDNPNTNALGVW